VGRRFDFQVPAPQIDSVGGYSSTNISGVYTVSKRIAVFAAVDNLFNRKYHEFLGFPDRGIYGRVGVKIPLVWRLPNSRTLKRANSIFRGHTLAAGLTPMYPRSTMTLEHSRTLRSCLSIGN